MKQYGKNRLPPAPPRRTARGLTPPARTSALDRTRSMSREHEERERRFDPKQRGSWKGSSRDLVVNGGRIKAKASDGYAFKLADVGDFSGWEDSVSDDWEQEMLSSSEARRLKPVGFKVIDGARCVVFETGDKTAIYAQAAQNTKLRRNSSDSDLEEFLNAYLVTALWSSTDNSDESGGDPLDANYSIDDIEPRSLEKARADCAMFIKLNHDLIDSAELSRATKLGGKMGAAGHDFWLTRNRHGAGFWDGDWSEPEATKLTESCRLFTEVDATVDDGQVHFDGGGMKMRRNGAPGDSVPENLREIDFRYNEPPDESGDQIRMNAYDAGSQTKGGRQWYDVGHAGGSDYSGGSVTKANYNRLQEMLEEEHPSGQSPAIWATTYGGHGSYGIIVVWEELDESIQEVLNGLDEYASIDDEALSEVENEAEEEAWSSWARSDFERAFIKSLNAQMQDEHPDYELDDFPEGIDSYTLFRLAMDGSNTYWAHEEGGNAYVDVDDVVDGKGGAIDIVVYDKRSSHWSPGDDSYLDELDKALDLKRTK